MLIQHLLDKIPKDLVSIILRYYAPVFTIFYTKNQNMAKNQKSTRKLTKEKGRTISRGKTISQGRKKMRKIEEEIYIKCLLLDSSLVIPIYSCRGLFDSFYWFILVLETNSRKWLIDQIYYMYITFSKNIDYSKSLGNQLVNYRLNQSTTYLFRNCLCMQRSWDVHFSCPHTVLRLCESLDDLDKHATISCDRYDYKSNCFINYYSENGEHGKKYTFESKKLSTEELMYSWGCGECLTSAAFSTNGLDRMKLLSESYGDNLLDFLKIVQLCYPKKIFGDRKRNFDSSYYTSYEKVERDKPMWQL